MRRYEIKYFNENYPNSITMYAMDFLHLMSKLRLANKKEYTIISITDVGNADKLKGMQKNG